MDSQTLWLVAAALVAWWYFSPSGSAPRQGAFLALPDLPPIPEPKSTPIDERLAAYELLGPYLATIDLSEPSEHRTLADKVLARITKDP
jgi:hypothetical protein